MKPTILVIPEASQRLSGTQGPAHSGRPWVPALRASRFGRDDKRGLGALLIMALAALWLATALPAVAAPKFPPLSGRVVDEANILSPQVEQDLTVRLKTLEDTTGRQLVVATVPSLQGYEIEDYGYQLGRSWGLGDKTRDDGVILLVAPTEKKVRIEVGYGLEPVLTDALSSVIIQSAILPKFKAGDLPGGIVAGADELVTQLSLPEDQAKAKVAQAAEPRASSPGSGFSPIAALLIGLFVFFLITRLLPGRRGRRSGLGAALPWIILDALTSGNGRGGGGGFGGGGGGFSGGGGSFGGGGSSGSW